MSYFKKFTDFLSFLGAMAASVFLVGAYMSYSPAQETLDELGMSKLSHFLSTQNAKEYRQYVIFIALLLFSVAVGRIFKRIPVLTLAVSTLPFVHAMSVFLIGTLYEHPSLYLLISALNICGNLYEATSRDLRDGKKRTFTASTVLGVLATLFCVLSVYINRFSEKLNAAFLSDALDEEQLEFEKLLRTFGLDLLGKSSEDEPRVLIMLAAMLLVGVLVALILRGVYFIDVILAAVPFVYSIYALHTESLVSAPMLVFIPICVYFFSRLTLFISGAGVRR